MKAMIKLIGLTLLICTANSQYSSAAEAEQVTFISCPIDRDTRAGRKSGCWLAEDPKTGIRYDITQSPTKPDWNFSVLVEGIFSATQDNPCGGKVLAPVRVSVLPEQCPQHLIPGEDFPGRPYSLPERNVKPLSMAKDIPAGPYIDQTFYLFFDFNSDFIIYQFGDYFLDKTITWLRAAKPEKIIITGFAATERMFINGLPLSEQPHVARKRAEKAYEALVRLGIDKKRLQMNWKTNPQPVAVDGVDGLASSSLRRGEIRAIMHN